MIQNCLNYKFLLQTKNQPIFDFCIFNNVHYKQLKFIPNVGIVY